MVDHTAYVTARLPSSRKLAYLLTQDWHRADDVVQTAITQLYRHWHRISRMDDPDGYVRKIVVHAFLGERRRWGSRVWLTAEPPDTATGTEDRASRVAVRTALAAVPPRQQATLVLRFSCDLSVGQVAETLGCSRGTVESQTARGLEALRRALADTPTSHNWARTACSPSPAR